MICAHCGCENPEGIAYCRDCGMSLRAQPARIAAPTPTPEVAAALPQPNRPSEIPCPRCREMNPLESRFCHSCGYALAPPAGAAMMQTPTPAPIGPAPPVPVAAPQMPMPAPAPVATPAPLAASSGPTPQLVPSLPRPAVPVGAPVSGSGPAVAIVCSRCRGVADPGADFCKFCGARLTPSMQSGDPVPSPAPEARRDPVAVAASPPRAVASGPVAPVASSNELLTPGPGAIAPAKPPMASTKALHGIGDVQSRGRLVRIAKDGSEGVAHPITNDQTDIGRAEGQIVLPEDPYLSPRHARILSKQGSAGGGLFLVDLGSVNGTYVRIRAPHTLAHGDLLLLGQQVLRFEAVSELEGARGPAMQHGVLLFGSPAPVARARLCQRTVEGLVRDVLYLVKDELTLGREMGDRTFPEDVFMSRRHGAIRREGASYVLHDLGSSNGTFVQIHAEHALQNADQFRVGHHLFRVDVGPPAGNGA